MWEFLRGLNHDVPNHEAVLDTFGDEDDRGWFVANFPVGVTLVDVDFDADGVTNGDLALSFVLVFGGVKQIYQGRDFLGLERIFRMPATGQG
jgi:hypothetical protein